MNHELLLAVVFIFQIHVISIWLPISLVKSQKLRLSTNVGSGVNHNFNRRYLIANALAAGFGIFVLSYVLGLDANADMTLILMAIGACFLVQMAPLAVAWNEGLIADGAFRRFGQKSRGTGAEDSRLSDFVPRVLVYAAVLAMITYLSISFWQWDGRWNTNLIKIVVFVFSNAVLAMLLFTLYRRVTYSSGAQYQAAALHFARAAPTLVVISLGLSVYFLGKEWLFLTDLHQLRPMMMSLFLQALAVVVYMAMRVRSESGLW